jgi:hypothetical protein
MNRLVIFILASSVAFAQRSTVSVNAEINVGANTHIKVGVNRNPAFTSYLNRITADIAIHASIRLPFSVDIAVAQNAYRKDGLYPCRGEGGRPMPMSFASGDIEFPRPLLESMKTEGEVEHALAHAMAHAALRHYARMELQRQLMELTPRPPNLSEERFQQMHAKQLDNMARQFEHDAHALAERMLAESGLGTSHRPAPALQ